MDEKGLGLEFEQQDGLRIPSNVSMCMVASKKYRPLVWLDEEMYDMSNECERFECVSSLRRHSVRDMVVGFSTSLPVFFNDSDARK